MPARVCWRDERRRRPLRIVLFAETFLPHTDGVVTRLTHTLRELRAAGDDVLVVAPDAKGLPEAYEGAQVVPALSMPLPVYRDMRIGSPLASPRLKAIVRRFRPEIIHAANPFVLGRAAFTLARHLRVPLIASYHTHLAQYTTRYHLSALESTCWAYLRHLHNRAMLNLCTSRPVLEELSRRSFERLDLWEPGVDAERFNPAWRSAEWRERLTGGRPDATILLSVGRLAAEKRLDLLAPALAHLLPGCHLAIVGRGPAEEEVRAEFAGLPVTFLGPLFGDDLSRAYASADIFALPSPTETLGLVALEAMASGLPVVAARAGGVPDLVADGQTGLLCPPEDAASIMSALRTLIENEEMRQRMGAAGRARAEGWSWTRTTAGLRRQYSRVVAARHPRRAAAEGAVGD
jgi:glycosyltransferase involved in cell wall biosynthesis